MRRCSGGRVSANGSRALRCASRNVKSIEPLYLSAPALVIDLDAAAPRPRKFRRVRILIDLDLLDRRRRDADLASLHAVDHEGDAAVPSADASRNRDSVPTMSRSKIGRSSQVLVVHHDGVAIGVRGGADHCDRRVDGDLLRLRREFEHDRLRRDWAPGGHSDLDPGGTEAFELNAERVRTRRDPLNDELAFGIGHGRLEGSGSTLVSKFYARTLEHGAGLIAYDTVQRRQIRRSILHEPEEEDEQGSSRHIEEISTVLLSRTYLDVNIMNSG